MKRPKQSESLKRKYATGWFPWKGKKHSEETKRKISEGGKGRKLGPMTKAHKNALSEARKKSDYCRELSRKEAKKMAIKNGFSQSHPRWNNEMSNYQSIHEWLRNKISKPNHCEICGLTGEKKTKDGRNYYHWSNITGIYNRDMKNWWMLCAKCHKRYDSKKRSKK